MDANTVCAASEVMMILNKDVTGIPINITDDAMTTDFHNTDSSLDKRELLVPSESRLLCINELPSMSSNPSNLSANTSAS